MNDERQSVEEELQGQDIKEQPIQELVIEEERKEFHIVREDLERKWVESEEQRKAVAAEY